MSWHREELIGKVERLITGSEGLVAEGGGLVSGGPFISHVGDDNHFVRQDRAKFGQQLGCSIVTFRTGRNCRRMNLVDEGAQLISEEEGLAYE